MERSQLDKSNKNTHIIESKDSIPRDFNVHDFNFKHDKSLNNIWIIDKNRNKLNETEEQVVIYKPNSKLTLCIYSL